MPILEVRRHAERADRADEASALSERGRALCRELAPRCGPYALVLASPAARAKETAERLGRPLDGPSFGYCEGVRVTFRGGEPAGLDVVRV